MFPYQCEWNAEQEAVDPTLSTDAGTCGRHASYRLIGSQFPSEPVLVCKTHRDTVRAWLLEDMPRVDVEHLPL